MKNGQIQEKERSRGESIDSESLDSNNNTGLGAFDPVPNPGLNQSLEKRHTLRGSALLEHVSEVGVNRK